MQIAVVVQLTVECSTYCDRNPRPGMKHSFRRNARVALRSTPVWRLMSAAGEVPRDLANKGIGCSSIRGRIEAEGDVSPLTGSGCGDSQLARSKDPIRNNLITHEHCGVDEVCNSIRRESQRA